MTAAPATARPARRAPARRPGPGAAGWAAACLLAFAAGAPHAASTPSMSVRVTAPPYRVRAAVIPPTAELGQQVTYKAWVNAQRPARARWLTPDSSAAFTWGTPRVSVTRTWVPPTHLDFDRLKRKTVDIGAPSDIAGRTLLLEIPLQAFALGRLTVPGVGVEIDDGRGPRVFRLPAVTLDVVPVLTAADSNADYRALHDPFAAPWWERVPWIWVVLGVLLAAAAFLAFRAWRRRRVAAPAPAAAGGPPDPRAEALAALAAVRAMHLPEKGRFAEHAFRLGQILRVFLEATTGVARPGDTTPELVAHLREAGLEPDDLTRLSGLLRVWDRVKFARDPFTLDEAVRAERAIEMFLRRPAVVVEKVA